MYPEDNQLFPQKQNPLDPSQIFDSAIPKPEPKPQKPIAQWNWGAFCFHWIWGLCNQCPVALWWFVPVLGPIVMPFILGFKGNQWAWENKEWGTAENFHRIQKKWAIAAAIFLCLNIIFGFTLGSLSIQNLKKIDFTRLAYEIKRKPASRPEKAALSEVLKKIEQDQTMTQELGAPLKAGDVLRVRRFPRENPKEDILCEFEIIGTHQKISVFVDATVDTGIVVFRQVVLFLKNPNRRFWLVPYYGEKIPAA